MSSSDIHSTGRGGAGNIGAGEGVYLDGNLVREGGTGGARSGDYSLGRGGLGNMVHPSSQTDAPDGPNPSGGEIIPESAVHHVMSDHEHETYHYGRGGVGNVHLDGGATSTTGSHHQRDHQPQSHQSPRLQAEHMLEKAKHAMGLDKKHSDK